MFLKITMYNLNSLWSSLIVSFTLLTLLFLRIAQCHYSHYDQYLDPCKASGYLGDIAMSDEEFRDITKRAVLELLLKSGNDSDSIHDLQVEDPFIHTGGSKVDKINNDDKSQLKELEDDMKLLKKTLHTKRAELKRKCQLKTKKECRNFRSDLKENIRETRDKLKQLKNQLNKLQKKRSVKGDNQEMSLLALKKHSQVKKGKQGDKKKTTKKSAKSRARRAATAKKERLWDYGVIPFVIESNFSAANKALFQLAMRHWENYTCITFKDRDPEDENFIVFTERSCGCCSFVGKRGNGPQGISIGKNCDKFGIVVHELGHAVGFWHEHTRPDRDQHVQILYKNVMQGQDYNFKKLTPADVNSLGETYDYGSIMHYARNTFGRSTYLDTILPIRKPGVAVRPEIGQRVRLSPGDIRQANRLYNCPTCGKTLQESSDKFSHVPKPGQTEICQWRISATHGEKIVLNITKLDIPKSYSCESDYLEVRDGHYIKSPLLGRFCGDTVPETLTSGTRMWIEYRTRSGSGTGFEAQYEAICGGDIVKDEGFLSSPNYPEDYRPQKVCVWKITVSEGLSVALKFQSFEIENHDDCVYDYLEVRDGQSESSPLIGKYCGYRTPDDIRSTGRHLYVKFVSDGSVQKAGFFARFVKELDECEIYDHGCDHNCINTLGSYRCECKIGYELHSDGRRCEKACGGYIYAENGTITSPSYPEPYPPNKQCVWKIVAPNDHKINLNFTHFDIEGHNQGCEFDSLSVDSGDTGSNKIHEVFCGSIIPAPVTSEHNTLRIEFKSDNSVQKSGFTATFMTDKDECIVNNGGCQHVCKNTIGSYHCACHSGFTLHQDMHGCKEGGCQFDIKALNGTIASPNYPEYYPSKSDCVWKFSTVLGHRIRLTFKSFEVEPHQECTYDHVIVFDGDDRNAPKLGIFCGAVLPDPVISTGDTMFMLFFSDASVQRKGFEAEHDSVCGASLEATATPQVIVSHAAFGDHNYRNKEECDWLIESKDGQNILITFTAFSLESENECRYDYLVIYEGPKDTDGTHKKLCHSELPEPIITKSSHVLVRFRSDDTISRKGFSFTFQKHQPGQESREDEDEDLDFQWWSDVQGSSSNTS